MTGSTAYRLYRKVHVNPYFSMFRSLCAACSFFTFVMDRKVEHGLSKPEKRKEKKKKVPRRGEAES